MARHLRTIAWLCLLFAAGMSIALGAMIQHDRHLEFIDMSDPMTPRQFYEQAGRL